VVLRIDLDVQEPEAVLQSYVHGPTVTAAPRENNRTRCRSSERIVRQTQSVATATKKSRHWAGFS
jgi:hypothetical protein